MGHVTRTRRNPMGDRLRNKIGAMAQHGVRLPLSVVVALEENLEPGMNRFVADMLDAIVVLAANGDFGPEKADEAIGELMKIPWWRHPTAYARAYAVLGVLSRVTYQFGVEPLDDEDDELVALYIDTGDTYEPTLLWEASSGEWIWTSWGDYVEALEQSGERKFP